MALFGNDILFDASLHVTATIFLLYIIWNFARFEKTRKYFISSSILIVLLISIYRIVVKRHDVIGISLGVLLSLIAIWLSEKIVKK